MNDKKLDKVYELLKQVESVLNEMAFSRNEWVSRVRDAYLGGALKEYCKLKIARDIGVGDYWSEEINILLSHVSKYMDHKRVKLVRKFNRETMLLEAMKEVSTFQEKFSIARSSMMKKFPRKKKEIEAISYSVDDLFSEMVREFLPKYDYLLKDL